MINPTSKFQGFPLTRRHNYLQMAIRTVGGIGVFVFIVVLGFLSFLIGLAPYVLGWKLLEIISNWL